MIDTKVTDCTERAEEIGVKFTVFAARVLPMMAILSDRTTVSLPSVPDGGCIKIPSLIISFVIPVVFIIN